MLTDRPFPPIDPTFSRLPGYPWTGNHSAQDAHSIKNIADNGIVFGLAVN